MHALAYSDDIVWTRREGIYDYENTDLARKVIIACGFWASYWLIRLGFAILWTIVPSGDEIIIEQNLIASPLQKKKVKKNLKK